MSAITENTYKKLESAEVITSLKRSHFDKLEIKSIFHLIKNKDKSKVTKLLIDSNNGYNPSELNSDGETAFILACKCKKIANAFILLDIYGEQCLPHYIDSKGYNAIYYASVEAPNLVDRILMFPTGISSLSHIYPTGETILTKLILERKITQAESVIPYMTIESLNKVDNSGKTALILACEMNFINIANILINRGVILTFYDHSGNSALSYLLKKSESRYNKDFVDLCMLFIDTKNNLLDEKKKNEFIVYENSRFSSITSLPTSSSGNFGCMNWCIDSITCEHKILKKYKNYCGVITDDIVKEILFIKKMNEKNNSAIVINGIYIDNQNHFYIVMEPLAMTLYEYFKLVSFYSVPQTSRLNMIFNRMETIINDVHSIGVVHNDTKMENIMFDYKGNIYIIDFGISDFIGVSPYRHVVNNYSTTSYIKAPDNDLNMEVIIVRSIEPKPNDSIKPVGLDNDKSVKKTYAKVRQFNFLTSRKSYSSDIYSLGVTFIQGILKRNARFVSYNGDIFKVIKDINQKNSKREKSIMMERISESDLEKIKNFPFYNKLIRMINIDGNMRIERSSSLNFPSEYVEIPNKLINRSVHYKASEIKNQMYELSFLDRVFTTYCDSYLTMNKSNQYNLEYISILDRIVGMKIGRVSIDAYLNTLYNCVNYKGDEDKIVVCLSYMYIFSFTFEWFITEIEKFSELFNIPEYILSGKINSIIISILPSITFIPFSSLIGKMIINLQNERFQPSKISEIENKIFDNFVLYMTQKSENEIVYVWDFIQCFAHSSNNSLSFEAQFKGDSILSIFNRFN